MTSEEFFLETLPSKWGLLDLEIYCKDQPETAQISQLKWSQKSAIPSHRQITRKTLPRPIEQLKTKVEIFLENYSRGKWTPPPFSELKLTAFTDFQKRTLLALSKIPMGEKVSYKELAVRLDSPKSTRAVANVCAMSPFLLLVPCHRVVSSNKKSLGGYQGGSELKEILLLHESNFR